MIRMRTKSNRTTGTYSAISELDLSQKRFCDLKDGAIRPLAPAGSGKTLSLLWRWKTLAERSGKAKPKFLIITFTHAAREELYDRLQSDDRFRNVSPLITISTLNSWGFRRVKDLTHSPKLITTKKDRYSLIHKTLQPIWRKYITYIFNPAGQ